MPLLAEVPPPAHLVIRCAAAPETNAAWSSLTLLRRMRAHPALQRAGSVTVHDLHGRCLVALADARPPLELALPPGTYHVSLELCGWSRRYTVALQQGDTVELRVPGVAA